MAVYFAVARRRLAADDYNAAVRLGHGAAVAVVSLVPRSYCFSREGTMACQSGQDSWDDGNTALAAPRSSRSLSHSMKRALAPIVVLGVIGLISSGAAGQADSAGSANSRTTSSPVAVAPERVAELDHGWKLAMDSKLDPNDPVTRDIEREARKVLSRVQSLLPANDMTIHIALSDKSNEGYVLPEWGVGGHPEGTDTVWIIVQPQNPRFKPLFVGRGLPHEIHHAVRMRLPNWHWSLLECMIMEGLADHFMIEAVGGEPAPWDRALTEEQIQKYLPRIKRDDLVAARKPYAEFVEKYQTPWWFGRSGSDPIPGWAGYALGWRIVENYLREHPEARASSLVNVPAEMIARATPGLL